MWRSVGILAIGLCLWGQLAIAADSPADLLSAGRVDDAISALNGALSHSPNDAESHHLLCRAYYALGQWDHAISACEKAIALDQNNAEFHLWLGRTYGEKADVVNFLSAASLAKKTRAEFERAVGLNPFSVAARVDLAEFYLEAPGIVGGGHDKARAQAEALTKLSPASAHWVTGRIAEKDKDHATAEREYRAMIDSSQGSAWSWLSLGLYYRHNNRLDEMEAALQRVLDAPIDRPEALVDAASTLDKTNRNLPLAAELVRRYLKSPPSDQAPLFKAHFLLGNILAKQGDKPQAMAQYRETLELVKNFEPAQEALDRLGP